MRTPFAVALALIALPLSAQQRPHWIATWAPSQSAAAPIPPMNGIDRVPTYVDRTIRQIVHTTLGGDSIRVRLTNEYGERALIIGAAHLALCESGADIRAASDRKLTFNGRANVTLRPGAVIFSDPIAYAVPALSDITISLWVKDTIRTTTRHSLGLQTNYISAHGDFSAAAHFAADTTIAYWLWLAGVDVVNSKATGAIVTIGNSITDGYNSTPDSNRRWPDVLARRFLASNEPPKSVVNAGISANRVLSFGTGPSALARFDRDVLMQPGVTHVIVFDAITRDPSQPDRMLPLYDSGDHLHPSDAGYKAMGEAIDLKLFTRKRP